MNNKNEQEEIIRLSDQILRTYFCNNDLDLLLSSLAEDVIWLGGGRHQKAEGREAVSAAFLEGAGGMIPCTMSEEEYEAMPLGDDYYLCEAQSHLLAADTSEMSMDVYQRCSFVYRRIENGWEAVHIHNSVPFEPIQDGELFPVEAAKESYRHLQETLAEANSEIRRQDNFLTQLYNTVPCGIIQFTTDRSHRIIHANKRAWEIYGYTRSEYWSSVKDPFIFVLEEERELYRTKVESLKNDGDIVYYDREGRRKDGSQCFVSVAMARLLNADGEEVIQAVFNDITEAKRLELEKEREQLLENQLLRAAVLTGYPLILNVNLTKNSFDKIISDSFICKNTSGSNFDHLVKEAYTTIYPSYREVFRELFDRDHIMSEFQNGNREIFTEFRQLGDDGDYHWLSVHIIAVDNPYGQDTLSVMLFRVLDEQHAAQARQEQLLRDALEEAKAASNAKSDFLSRMSHDIRTPINAIVGMSTIGQLKIDDRNQSVNCFKKIDDFSRYLLSLINDILDMSKIENGKMALTDEQFDLHELINSITAIVYSQSVFKNIQFEVYCEDSLQQYYLGDALRMNQILMNLLSNSLKFTPAGGMITLHVKESKRRCGYSYLAFQVTDSGKGMSEDFMKRLYQPFEQEAADTARNLTGTGLGLSIVYNLVQLMNGTINVESRLGEGTVFSIEIPFRLVEDEIWKEEQRKQQELLNGMRILIVDDDEGAGTQAAAILDSSGAECTWASSGRKAVEYVRESLAGSQAYELALIDWKMPEMDGLETTRQIRKLVGRDTMIIMISAYDYTEIESEARAAGADYFISKPLFKTDLCNTLSRINVPKNNADTKTDINFQGCHFLLAEDNELNREIAQTLLEMEGACVDTAENGQAAVEAFAGKPEGYYEAVLMDIRMPVMDGLEATAEIRLLEQERTVRVPVIALSANAFDEDRQMAYKAGIDEYLIKPVEAEQLYRLLQNIL